MTTNPFRLFWPKSSSRIQGLVRFRWAALVSLFVGVFPLLQVGYLQKNQLPYVMAVLALLGVFNGLTEGVWSKAQPEEEGRLLFVQLLVDLLAAAGLLFVTGSANNPFIFILCVHAFLGGMLLRRWQSSLFISLVLLLLGILQVETYQDAQITVGVENRELFFGFLAQWLLTSLAWFLASLFSRIIQNQEERIRQLQERQFRADRLKSLGALTAGFSHQMATPLNSLKLRLERALRKSADHPAALMELEEAKQSLQECVSVFHSMASVFSNSAEGELQNVKMGPLLADIVRAWKQDNSQVQLEAQLEEKEISCLVQPLAFSNTVFDLLDNAAEASERSTAIGLRFFSEGSRVVLEVVDAGKGISEEMLSRLGEPFVTDKIHGNGLGLYAAHMAAQSMGGEFEIFNNQSGRGVTARLILPQGEVL